MADSIRLRVGVDLWSLHRTRVDAAMDELSSTLGPDRFELVEYEAAQLVSAREYWLMVYESIAKQYDDATYVTDLADLGSASIGRLSDLLGSMRYICIREVFPAIQFRSSAVAAARPRLGGRETWIATIDYAWGFAQRAKASLRYRTGRYLRRFGASSNAIAMVVAQANKNALLLAQLSEQVPFAETAMADIVATSLPLNPGSAPRLDPVVAYLTARLDKLDNAKETARDFVNGTWDVLLTDQEHDPAMRQVIHAALDHGGKRVVTTPEGAQSLVGAEMAELTRHVYMRDSRLIRCATSVGEAGRMAARFGTTVIESGYLAGHPSPRGVTTRLGEWLLARLVSGRSTPDRPLVLVNLDNEPDVGMLRSGVPSMAEKIASLVRLMDGLHDSGVRFMVTCKSTERLDSIRMLCRGRAEAVFANVPWRLLMAVSSAVIQRDSSLGPEAVAAGHPTIIWDDLGLPLASREWLVGNAPWVQSCTDESGLIDALDSIRHGITLKKSPQAWDLITPERQVAEWIVANRARGNEVRSD